MTQRKVLYIDPELLHPKESSNQDELVGINTTPVGGTTGQILKKESNTDYDYSWKDSYELATKEPTGFVDTVSSDILFDKLTRTFSITPTETNFVVYIAGEKFVKTATESIQIPNITGLHYIYYDDVTFQLTQTQTYTDDLIEFKALVAILYWRVDTQEAIYFGDQRHGIRMDGTTQKYLHLSFGAQYRSGLGLFNLFPDATGSLDAHAQFAIENGRFANEDLNTEITSNLIQQLNPIARIPIYYRLGSADNWYRNPVSNFPFIRGGEAGVVGTKPLYNREVNGVWSLFEVPNNRYFLTHIFATNDHEFPMIGVCGDEYNSKADARAGAIERITNLTGLPFDEFLLVATVIFEARDDYTNSVNAKVVSTDDGGSYIDWRASSTLFPPSSAGVIDEAGWANYLDTQYTALSPFTVVNGTSVTLPNNAGIVNEDYLPAGVTTFYDPTTQKIMPAKVGDYNIITIRFDAEAESTSSYFDFGIDIGGELGVIFKDTRVFPKGAGVPHPFSFVCPGFSLDTFIANGGTVKIMAVGGDVEIYNINFHVVRVSSP